MRVKVFIVSVLFVCSLLLGFVSAHNKVVVVPLSETQAVRPTAESYTLIVDRLTDGTSDTQYAYMIAVDSGECFLHRVAILEGAGSGDANHWCYIFDHTPSGKWALEVIAGAHQKTTCTARCLKW